MRSHQDEDEVNGGCGFLRQEEKDAVSSLGSCWAAQWRRDENTDVYFVCKQNIVFTECLSPWAAINKYHRLSSA